MAEPNAAYAFVTADDFKPLRTASPMDRPYTIIELEQGTPDWLGWRHHGIGASDAPAVMGESPWKNPDKLLREKRGRPRSSRPNAAMARGTRLEPEARKAYEARVGIAVDPVCLQSSAYSWMRASLDGISGDGAKLVEIKCGESAYRHTASHRKAPDYYYGQLQHILAVTGNASIDFWCWLPGCDGLLVPVTRDEAYIGRLIETQQRFWEQVVAGNKRQREPKHREIEGTANVGEGNMNDQQWIIIDTETDGLYEPIHVVEIAAQRMRGWEPDGSTFQIFLDHGVDIPGEAVAVHGYTKAFLRKHGTDPREAHEQFRDYVGNLPLVAHNLSYDWNRALCPEWARLGMDPIGQRGFCTMTLSRRAIDETSNYKLDTLRTHFQLKTGRSHHAANDVDAVVQLFGRVLGPRLEPLNFDSIEDLRKFSKKTPVAKCLSEVQTGCRSPEKTPKKRAKDAWYVLTADDQTHGPHKAAKLHELIKGEACYIWRDGMSDWTVSTDVDEFMKLAKKKPAKKTAKPKKRTLSKKMTELMGLCKGIMADDIVTAEEIMCLSDWLQNAGRIDQWPASEIAEAVERILEDGVITEAEQREMELLLRSLEIDDGAGNFRTDTESATLATAEGGRNECRTDGDERLAGPNQPTSCGDRTLHPNGNDSPAEVAGSRCMAFKFQCPHCDRHLEADEALVGRTIDCPSCATSLEVPPVTNSMAFKFDCPHCGQRLEATKDLIGRTFPCPGCNDPVVTPTPFADEAGAGRQGGPEEDFGATKDGEPATERQKEYAASLGVEYSADIGRGEMSDLITATQEKRDAEHREYVEALGRREGEAYERIRKDILREIEEDDCRLSQATSEQIVKAFEERDLGAILITFDTDVLDTSKSVSTNLDFAFSDNLSRQEVDGILVLATEGLSRMGPE
jgi:putative phage-type endonuclease